jgi:autoinducer 2 (AI-2) kinase
VAKYFLSLDAGTSGGKATVVSEDGNVVGFSKKRWNQHYTSPEDLDPYGCEFDPELFWNMLLQSAKEAIKSSQISPRDIKAVTSTSQRHGCVFLDAHGKELYAGPNRDARGLEVDTEEYMDNEEIFEITGHGLPFLFSLARLLWFRENEEEIFNDIKHLLTIDGWVNYRLSGNYVIDDTAAAETLLFNIHKRNWSEKILSTFEIPHEILPDRYEFGQVIGSIDVEVAKQLNIRSQVPIIMSAADTQASLIGCGSIKTNTLGIVAGSTMPIQMIVDKSIIDPNQNLWTGAFVNDLWVIESNAGSSGDIHKWFIESILSPLNVRNPYDKFEQLVLSQPPGSGGVSANLGPQIFSTQSMHSMPSSGGFSFIPLPYSFDTVIDISSFARALIENLAFAVRANIDQIRFLVEHSIDEIFLVGGVSRSKSFCQIIANVLNSEIKVYSPEGASIAGSFAGMIGTGKYNNLEQAVKVITNYTTFFPQQDQFDTYEELYPEWKELYETSRTED